MTVSSRSVVAPIAAAAVLLGSSGHAPAPPCVAAGLVYCRDAQELYLTADDRTVMSIDLDRRRVRWTSRLESDGIASNLAVTASTVAFGFGNDQIVGLSRSDGSRIWSTAVKTKSVLGLESSVVAQTDDSEGVVAVDAQAGRVLWQHAVDSGPPNYVGILAASENRILTSLFGIDALHGHVLQRWPSGFMAWDGAFAGRMTVLGDRRGHLVAYGSDQRVVWQKTLAMPGPRWALQAVEASTLGILVIIADPLTVNREADVRLIGLSSVGEQLWTRDEKDAPLSSYAKGTVVGDLAVYFSHLGGVSSYEMNTGRQRWRTLSKNRLDGLRSVCSEAECLMICGDPDMRSICALDLGTGAVSAILQLQKSPVRN